MARKKQTKQFNDDRRARAECFILCDYARAENGKLYIVGGGWDEIVPQRLPLEFETYLAIKIVLSWEVVAGPTATIVRAELLDANDRVLGDPVFETTVEGSPVDLPEELERRGRQMVALFMGNEAKMTLTEPGLFTLRLFVDDEAIATTTFRVAPPPPLLSRINQAPERPDAQQEELTDAKRTTT
jgi:hypothetical protein